MSPLAFRLFIEIYIYNIILMVNLCTLEKSLSTAKPKNKNHFLVHCEEKIPLLAFWFMGFLLSSLSL